MPSDQPPFSRSVVVETLPAAGLTMSVTPTETERAALATFNGLVAIPRLTATLQLRREGRDSVQVTGDLDGLVTATCVVTLEPFDAPLNALVDVHFVPAETLAALRAKAPALREDENPPDEPDLIEKGRIDVGALLAEHLTLALDPYPRKPDAALAIEASDEEPHGSAFAVLRAWGEKRS